MTEALATAVETALRETVDPVLQESLLALNAVDYRWEGKRLSVKVCLGYPAAGLHQQLADELKKKLAAVPGVEEIELEVESRISATGGEKPDTLAGVKNIIAVASGKGGVGKSTTAVNLALALRAEGATVGILDADIHGPSQPQMLGTADKRPGTVDNRYMIPIEAHGIKSNSMGYLVTERTPMVWRGPMVSGAFQQLIKQTQWGELDYLIIDMPPGTGDVQLTLSQSIPVSGAIIVTTPQDIALLDAKKGIEMFRKVKVPVLGVVENMAVHICSQCGHAEHIFGSGGGERIARQYDTTLLAALPLDLSIREQADGGCPSVAADPESAISQIYRQLARRAGAELWQAGRRMRAPTITVSDD